ncbi:unnamed protein product [Lactuca saligna]|uniref:Uncharacterized protein n=1 Tax=Lactuca saligna TaxID=75948 RepID=A0AA35VT38_LACSI|nr:unnamed protein product [Lactuca saligna]
MVCALQCERRGYESFPKEITKEFDYRREGEIGDQKAARWFVARLAIGGGLRGSTRLKKKKKNDRSSEAAVSSDEKKETKQRGCSSSVLEGVAKENEMAARPDGGRHLGKKMERLRCLEFASGRRPIVKKKERLRL